MHTKTLVFALLSTFILLIISCDNDDIDPVGELTEKEWVLGIENLDTTLTIITNGELTLTLSKDRSLCLDHGIRVIMTKENEEVYNKLTTSYFSSYGRGDVSGNTTFIIQTAIEAIPNSSDSCGHLGHVNCKVKYYE